MKVLMLGGTGAMGAAIINTLGNNKQYNLYVTSRKKRKSRYNNVFYIQGNAKDDTFLSNTLKDEYDVIIDFMVYKSYELSKRIDLLTESTNHYIFLSSARVFDNSKEPIIESSNRLIDYTTDENYKQTEEYAIEKGLEENLIQGSNNTNWTIIRPYITYNNNRLQLGVYEKELWLYRLLNNKPVAFSKEVAEKETTLTYALDVANFIIAILNKKEFCGQSFNVVTDEHIKWEEVLDIYINILKKHNYNPKISTIKVEDEFGYKYGNKYQLIYDRMYNRIFDNKKIQDYCKEIKFTKTREGLEKCLEEFVIANNEVAINRIPFLQNVYMDRITNSFTSLKEYKTIKDKAKYIALRFGPESLFKKATNKR